MEVIWLNQKNDKVPQTENKEGEYREYDWFSLVFKGTEPYNMLTSLIHLWILIIGQWHICGFESEAAGDAFFD